MGIDESDEVTPKSERLNADEQFCPSCGEIIKKEAEICPNCGVRQQSKITAPIDEVTPPAGEKNPGVAALASFILPGAGQVYNGQIGKGVIILLIYIVSWISIAVLIGILTTPLIWIYAIYDAYKTAEKINAGDILV